ncbi:DUF3164 family protein [Chromobacterium sp. IIBBL 290-4]|nr:DUF3164 family protein [Chromobacterium sp. IIBBL 290-4]UTH73527.1 DUF3164 family protein [Chromobacterium sp. IIBBL 290-4]
MSVYTKFSTRPALTESIRVQCSKAYVRIERRSEGTGKFEAVRLDLAGV